MQYFGGAYIHAPLAVGTAPRGHYRAAAAGQKP